LAYFEQLKSSDTGWQLAISTLVTQPALSDHVKFFCLQVVEAYIKQVYIKANPTQQQAIRSFLSQWIQLQVRTSLKLGVIVIYLLIGHLRFLSQQRKRSSYGIKLHKFLHWYLSVIIQTDGLDSLLIYCRPWLWVKGQ
jgi:hypothetical protein